MSDPVSNHDIEDVLSSIRRLVAQGDPKRIHQAANAPTPLHPGPAATSSNLEETRDTGRFERLVLTPAFRIPDAPDEAAATPEPAEVPATKSFDAAIHTAESDTIPTKDERPLPPPAQSPSERESLEATIAELEAAVNSRADDWEPDGSEVVPTIAFSPVFRSKIDAARVPLREVETSAETPEATVSTAVADHIAETIAEELQDAFPHLQAADETTDLETEDQVEEVEADVTASIMTEDDGIAEIVEVTDVEIEEPRVITPQFRHSAFQEVYDPVAEATADAAEAAPDADEMYGDDLAPDPEDVVMGSAVANPVEGRLIDPDMMREMVSQMIREELQGEMGERITRNVRKLVRREINRVLSAQEFE